MKNWLFRWVVDSDGDIGLQIARILTVTKYKNGSIINWIWDKEEFNPAPKYLK